MPFDLVEPPSVAEALSLLDPLDPEVRAIAGGTALMLMMKSGFFRPRRLVSLGRIAGDLAGIRATPEGGLAIGAMTVLRDVERSALVRERAPVIADALLTHSNIRVRNVATVGGNLAHGDPHMDLPPVLMALGASVTATGPGGSRTLDLGELITGYFTTALGNDELITAVAIPPQQGRQAVYVKCTTRAADDWPALGIAVSLGRDGGIVREPRIALGAAVDRARRLTATEAVLDGREPTPALFAEAAEVAAGEVEPVGDDRGSADYKRQLIRVHLRRALSRLVETRR